MAILAPEVVSTLSRSDKLVVFVGHAEITRGETQLGFIKTPDRSKVTALEIVLAQT
jgi:hypothetical protein